MEVLFTECSNGSEIALTLNPERRYITTQTSFRPSLGICQYIISRVEFEQDNLSAASLSIKYSKNDGKEYFPSVLKASLSGKSIDSRQIHIIEFAKSMACMKDISICY